MSIGSKVFDSREVVDRIAQLERERDSHPTPDGEEDGGAAWATDYPDDADELATLVAFREEVRSSEFDYGLTFVRDDYFQEYAEEYAEDVCEFNDAGKWPYCHIDWNAAAEALKQDYTSVEFDGDTYWYLYV